MGQEVRANGLQVPLGSAGQSTNGLEVLLSTPAPGDEGKGCVNSLHSNHCDSVPRWFVER